MFVNSEAKLPNIRRVQTINHKRTSRRHLQQPVSADCSDTVRWSNTIGKNVDICIQSENGAGTVLASHAFWLSVVRLATVYEDTVS